MEQLKTTLVALHGAVVVQFSSAPHYVEESVIVPGGHTVNFVTGDGPDLRLSRKDTDLPDGETKRKYTITLQVPAGRNLRKPVAIETGADRDLVVEALKNAFGLVTGGGGADIKVITADGKEHVIPEEAPAE